jgi:hypothetical protein
VNFLKVANKKLSIQEYTMHGRHKRMVARQLDRGPEGWCAMEIIALAALDAFVHQEVHNAITKGFMEEEPNVVNQERKRGIGRGRKMGQYT